MTKQDNGNTFTQVVETLLSGQIICDASSEHMYLYLKEPFQQQEVELFLRRLGRKLKGTTDNSGFFAAYQSLDSHDAMVNVRRYASEAVNEMEPLIRLMRILISTEKTNKPIMPGDTVRKSELYESIESAPHLVAEVDHISRGGMFSNANTDTGKQLDAILKKLCEKEYLIQSGSGGIKYLATAKWSRLYELLEFIVENEKFDLDEEDDVTQKELDY